MTTYFWAKIELLGRRVRYGRCSVVDFLGTQLLRVDVPYPEPKFEDRERHQYRSTELRDCTIEDLQIKYKLAFGAETTPPNTRDELLDRLVVDAMVNERVEQFEFTEDFGAGAIYCRTILAEEQVREALKPWKTPVLALPESTGDESLWDDDMPTPSPLANVLDRIECADWPATWTPGERVLLLASQGFLGVGRVNCGNLLEAIADKCMSDAEALRSLLHFQAHERADLPFPIRELLGINRDGDVCYGADDIDEYLRQTGNDNPFEGPSSEKDKADLAQAIQEVLTPEIERPATPAHKATTSDNGKTWSYEFYDVDGDKLFVQSPRTAHVTPHVAEIGLIVNTDPTLAIWCPDTAQLKALHNRIGDILNVDSSIGQQSTDYVDIDDLSHIRSRLTTGDFEYYAHDITGDDNETKRLVRLLDAAIVELRRWRCGNQLSDNRQPTTIDAPYELSNEFATEANAVRDALSDKPTPRFIDIDKHSYVAAHIDLDECVRCHGGIKTHPLISQDGSANFGEYCLVCKCSWSHAFPLPPEPGMVRPSKPAADVDVRIDPRDSTRVNVSINGAYASSPFDMNEGYQTSRAAIDAAIAREKPVVYVDDPDLRETMREVFGDSAVVDGAAMSDEKCPRCKQFDCTPECIAAEAAECDAYNGPEPEKFA